MNRTQRSSGWKHLRAPSVAGLEGLTVLSTDGDLVARTYTSFDEVREAVLHIVVISHADGRLPTGAELAEVRAMMQAYCLGFLARYRRDKVCIEVVGMCDLTHATPRLG